MERSPVRDARCDVAYRSNVVGRPLRGDVRFPPGLGGDDRGETGAVEDSEQWRIHS